MMMEDSVSCSLKVADSSKGWCVGLPMRSFLDSKSPRGVGGLLVSCYLRLLGH